MVAKIYTPLTLVSLKKRPECNVLVGSCEPLISYAESVLGLKAEKISQLEDSMVIPGVLYRVESQSHIRITQEKVLSKLGIWLVDSLEPGSLAVKEIVEEACKIVKIKSTPELITSVGWKFFEGSGEILDVNSALIEAVAWIQLPLDPKPVLPWEDHTGFFRLSQVERELKGYKAWKENDLEKMTSLGCKESRVSRWNLDPTLINQTLELLSNWHEGYYEEDLVKEILKILWSNTTKSRSKEISKPKRSKK